MEYIVDDRRVDWPDIANAVVYELRYEAYLYKGSVYTLKAAGWGGSFAVLQMPLDSEDYYVLSTNNHVMPRFDVDHCVFATIEVSFDKHWCLSRSGKLKYDLGAFAKEATFDIKHDWELIRSVMLPAAAVYRSKNAKDAVWMDGNANEVTRTYIAYSKETALLRANKT